MSEVPLESFCNQAMDMGANQAKIIPAQDVVVKNWVRVKCRYGCGGYGKCLTCPPYSPTPEETRNIIADYNKALLMRFRECEECGNSRAANIHKVIFDLERECFLSGYHGTFGMASGPCNWCAECNLNECQHPGRARPSMEACGIDVFTTARKAGFEIQVLTSKDQIPTCYGLLLIE